MGNKQVVVKKGCGSEALPLGIFNKTKQKNTIHWGEGPFIAISRINTNPLNYIQYLSDELYEVLRNSMIFRKCQQHCILPSNIFNL